MIHRITPAIALSAIQLAVLVCSCAPHENRAAHTPTIVVPNGDTVGAQREPDSAPSLAIASAPSTPVPSPAEPPTSPPNEVVSSTPEEPGSDNPEPETYTPREAKQREAQKRRALALVHQLPEVKAYCQEPSGCTLVEDEPTKNCQPSDDDKRTCAWVIAVAHVEPSGPHLSFFARFYVRNSGQLFVEPIQTGEVVTVREWRCLQKHSYDSEACAKKNGGVF